ncbi:MAG: trypsin-like peptidase domain-containing protein [Cyanobium usitatum Tobar12.5m-G36]|nr:trypsin-like peptidase domain-containing protein [Cyanobium usitatum Tobar12.5m-G36]
MIRALRRKKLNRWNLVGVLILCCSTELAWAKAIANTFNPASVVRIEGPVQGSGTLVAKNGDIYTLLTAWHVLSSVREGEELYAVTNTGVSYRIPIKSIIRVGNVDMALARFRSLDGLKIAEISAEDVRMGEDAEVIGYPVTASKKLALNKGHIVANAKVGVEEGYQLLYKIETSPGMSGGPVVDKFGNVVGVHGRGELDERAVERTGKIIKTGINYGVPVKYLVLALTGKDASHKNDEPISFEDYYAKTLRLWRSKKDHGGEYGISLASRLISLTSDKFLLMWAYLYRRDMYEATRQYKYALADNALAYSLAESVEMQDLIARSECSLHWALKDYANVVRCWDSVISIRPLESEPYSLRGFAWSMLKEWQKGLRDFEAALSKEPSNTEYLIAASRMNWFLADYNQSILYANKALSINADNIEAIMLRATIFESMKSYPEAIKDLSRAGQLLKPDDPRKYDIKFTLIRLQKM